MTICAQNVPNRSPPITPQIQRMNGHIYRYSHSHPTITRFVVAFTNFSRRFFEALGPHLQHFLQVQCQSWSRWLYAHKRVLNGAPSQRTNESGHVRLWLHSCCLSSTHRLLVCCMSSCCFLHAVDLHWCCIAFSQSDFTDDKVIDTCLSSLACCRISSCHSVYCQTAARLSDFLSLFLIHFWFTCRMTLPLSDLIDIVTEAPHSHSHRSPTNCLCDVCRLSLNLSLFSIVQCCSSK